MVAFLRKTEDSHGDLIRGRAYSLIRDKSFIRKPVILSSGKASNHYFDMKFSMLDPLGTNLFSEMILAKLPATRVDYVGGLELGAVPLIGCIAMMSYQTGRPIPGLIVRKKAKEHGSQRLVEGADDLHHKNVVIVDDVTTTGDSAMKSIEAIKAVGANIILVISILDREEGASELYRKSEIPFDPLFRASEFLNG
jgi:orotate phosphoribosyltransferase